MVFRKSAIIVGAGWASLPISLLTSVIIARALGPEGKGVLFVLTSLQAVLTALFGLGLPAAASYLLKEGRWSFREIVWGVLSLTAASSLLAASLLFVACEWVLRIAGGSADVSGPILALVVLTLPLFMGAVAIEVLMVVQGSMRLYALKTLGPALATATLTVLLVLVWPMGLLGAAIAIASGILLQFVVCLIFLARNGGLSRPALQMPLIFELLRLGLPQSGNSILSTASKRLDALLVVAILGVGPAGLYSISNSLQTIFGNIPRATMWPLVGELAGERPDTQRLGRLARLTRLQTALGLVGSAVLIPIVAWLVPIVFGERFAAAAPAAAAAVAMLAILPVSVSLNALFVGLGKPQWVNAPLAAGVAAQYLAAVAMLPRLGILGAALAVLSCHLVFGMLLAVKARRELGLGVFSLFLPRLEDLQALWSRAGARLAARNAG